MINFFSNWAEQIIIAVVITSIIEMLLPENKNKKYIKIVMGIYILFSIISPVVNKKNLLLVDSVNLESFTVEGNSINNEEVNQASMDERLQQLYVQELENNIKNKIKQEGYDVKKCKVDAVLHGDESKQGINKITVVVSKEDDANIKNEEKINLINKVEIQVGLDRFIGNSNDSSQKNNSDINHLKDVLSTYYEIDSSKISVSIK